ncbi:MAG: helix-turn-helix domain-containing protein [Treponema sp.]|jgi:transcriptional regulator with XRE-family HTH domain|nr:helix-turn-helix domain-containing protein [Treponema sp.]
MGFQERIRELMKVLKVNQGGLASILRVSQGVISEFATGAREPSKEFMLGISKLGISLDWFVTGDGTMFRTDRASNQEVSGSGIVGVAINAGGYGHVENSGNHMTVISDQNKLEQTLVCYEIPLLTKEQVLHFNPTKEIPDPKAHSGDYPDSILSPIPIRFREYSTDLRAMLVFNNLMADLLNAGDVVIFQATGWNKNGVYVYRMRNELYISHVRFDGRQYVLRKEFKPDEEIPCHAESFEPIGRIRAVLKEVP